MLSTTPRFARTLGLAATMAALAVPAGAVARPSPEEQGVRQAHQSAAAPADRGPTRSSEVGTNGGSDVALIIVVTGAAALAVAGAGTVLKRRHTHRVTGNAITAAHTVFYDRARDL
ncbi:MAG: hypothetical protein QOK49_2197 [Baekduia sp.]|jgi:hypothetical protein|nr:hypothetical protein [Baekduia sp.]